MNSIIEMRKEKMFNCNGDSGTSSEWERESRAGEGEQVRQNKDSSFQYSNQVISQLSCSQTVTRV